MNPNRPSDVSEGGGRAAFGVLDVGSREGNLFQVKVDRERERERGEAFWVFSVRASGRITRSCRSAWRKPSGSFITNNMAALTPTAKHEREASNTIRAKTEEHLERILKYKNVIWQQRNGETKEGKRLPVGVLTADHMEISL